MPIMSAAAVDAVRDGFRCTLNAASRPEARPTRRKGRPIIQTIGRTSREKIAASATNIAIAPRTSTSRRRPTGMPLP